MSSAPSRRLLLAELLEVPKLLLSLVQPGLPVARGEQTALGILGKCHSAILDCRK